MQSNDEATVRKAYMTYLGRFPDEAGLRHYTNAMRSGHICGSKLNTILTNSPEGQTLLHQKRRFRDVLRFVENVRVDDGDGHIGILYCGPVGSSGYSVSAQDYLKALWQTGKARIEFKPIQYYNTPAPSPHCSEGYKLMAVLSSRALFSSDNPPDVILVHATADMWTLVIDECRSLFPSTPIVGVTVWETNHVPRQWYDPLNRADHVIVPCSWNKIVFESDIARLKHSVSVVHHVIERKKASQASAHRAPFLSLVTQHSAVSYHPSLERFERDRSVFTDRPYVFYCVGEFNNRKGIADLIRAYLAEFSADDNVLLYVKTNGDVSHDTACRFVYEQQQQQHDSDRSAAIILDYRILPHEDIMQIHRDADCFVSLTKSEGVGIGACEAAFSGNPIIVTRFGGQLDYLVDVDFVNYRLVPANYCSGLHQGSEECNKRGWCMRNGLYDAKEQEWAQPDLSHAQELMRRRYANSADHIPSPRTVQYLENHFNGATIGKRMLSVLENVCGKPSSANDNERQQEQQQQQQQQQQQERTEQEGKKQEQDKEEEEEEEVRRPQAHRTQMVKSGGLFEFRAGRIRRIRR